MVASPHLKLVVMGTGPFAVPITTSFRWGLALMAAVQCSWLSLASLRAASRRQAGVHRAASSRSSCASNSSFGGSSP
ncbi:MAG: hypothetical protein ACK48M_01440, partial [Planctomycetia bacterium]